MTNQSLENKTSTNGWGPVGRFLGGLGLVAALASSSCGVRIVEGLGGAPQYNYAEPTPPPVTFLGSLEEEVNIEPIEAVGMPMQFNGYVSGTGTRIDPKNNSMQLYLLVTDKKFDVGPFYVPVTPEQFNKHPYGTDVNVAARYGGPLPPTFNSEGMEVSGHSLLKPILGPQVIDDSIPGDFGSFVYVENSWATMFSYTPLATDKTIRGIEERFNQERVENGADGREPEGLYVKPLDLNKVNVYTVDTDPVTKGPMLRRALDPDIRAAKTLYVIQTPTQITY